MGETATHRVINTCKHIRPLPNFIKIRFYNKIVQSTNVLFLPDLIIYYDIPAHLEVNKS